MAGKKGLGRPRKETKTVKSENKGLGSAGKETKTAKYWKRNKLWEGGEKKQRV